jgi:uncharacterized 2Fe-2S/4Fe-4S cluster protein (DUF4445 family)
MNEELVRIRLEPLSVEVEIPRGAPLSSILAERGVEFPCAGASACGGCRVRVLAGSLPVGDADRTVFSARELADGWRLACQARAETPLVLDCGQWHMDVLAGNGELAGSARSGLGIAIDLGTTTIAAQTIDLATGRVLAVETLLNPQVRFGADVMSRIQAALSGADLTGPIRLALAGTIAQLAAGRAGEVVEVVLVGNTVMHHLFSGLDLKPLSHVPFQSPHLEAQLFAPAELGWPLPATCRIRMERCLGGFVGSDILAGILAVGMAHAEKPMALIDLGTNGEIAIGNRDRIVCASTAAGPAFEAGSIRMGMRAVTGAISHVALENGALRVVTVGGVPPRGICGSGLVDAAAVGLKSGAILPSGRIAHRATSFPIVDPVVLVQGDIRELQLAKAAIASGFRLLLRRLGLSRGDLECVHLAGAFGNYVGVQSAIEIGLIEGPEAMVRTEGNTALHGAKLLLLSPVAPGWPQVEHLSLASEPDFEDEYVSCMALCTTERGR